MAAARNGRANKTENGYHHHKHGWSPSSVNVVLCGAVGLMMTMSFLLYLSILVSPGLVQKLLEAHVVQCNAKLLYVTGHPAPNSMLSVPESSNNARDYTNMYGEKNSSFRHYNSTSNSNTTQRDGQSIKVQCCSCEPELLDRQHSALDDRDNKTGTLQKIEEEAREEPKFRILVGVLTTAAKVDRRNLLRLAYSLQSSPDADVTVRFVMGALESGDSKDDPFANEKRVDKTLVGMENATYGDIIILSCRENLNEGKTFAYFSSLPDIGVEYDYVMKTDDDSYIRFDNLGRSLKPLSRTDLYYGYILPCDNQDAYQWYMAGMGYLISWDLVLWIRDSPIPRNKSVGTEDQLVGDWFNLGGVAKHRVNEKPLFYDHLGFGGPCAHELVPETILVHQVKTRERWADVLGFFETDHISRALSRPSPSPS